MVCEKCREEILDHIKGMIDYRGGMGNRIDAFDIKIFLQGARIYEEKLKITKGEKKWKERIETFSL